MNRIRRELFKNSEQERVNPKSEAIIHNIEISGEPNSSNNMDLRKLRQYLKILLASERITKEQLEGSKLVKLRGI